MRISQNDELEVKLAKKAAMICHYAIRNPLHVFFEDGNVHRGSMSFERECNDMFRKENGKLMYEFIREFLNEFEELPTNRRWPVYFLYRKKAEYLHRKWRRKIVSQSSHPENINGGFIYKHYLGEDGHIYVKTDIGVVLRWF